MPRITPDLANATASIPLLDKDSYTFLLGEKKPFCRKNDDGKLVYGVLYTITDKNNPAVRLPYSVYLHGEAESLGYSLQFLMAASGFDPKDKTAEREFKAQYGESYWLDVDEDNLVITECGELFDKLSGGMAAADIDMKPNKKTGDMQNTFKWRPAV